MTLEMFWILLGFTAQAVMDVVVALAPSWGV